MTSIVSDLLGKRVTVNDCTDWGRVSTRLVTGLVRAVAMSTPTAFSILLQIEKVHQGNRTVGTLVLFTIPSDVEAHCSTYEFVVEGM